jgi:hypothetical protein
MLGPCGLLAAAPQSPQEEEDGTRKLWNKQFEAARTRARKPAVKTTAKIQTSGATSQPAVQPKARPAGASAPPAETSAELINDELIGVTIWRLRKATAADADSKPRLLAQQGQFVAERASPNTTFRESDLVRLSVEVPRAGDHYLYVIDREVYAGGAMSDPYLIFPTKGTRGGNNVVTAGMIVDIPAPEDNVPFFNFTSVGKGRLSERLTLIVSPQPLALPLGDGPLPLTHAQVAQWEQQSNGVAERRESLGGELGWTEAEKEAGEGKRLLTQSDPLPQTIYRVKTQPSGLQLLVVSLRVAP